MYRSEREHHMGRYTACGSEIPKRVRDDTRGGIWDDTRGGFGMTDG